MTASQVAQRQVVWPPRCGPEHGRYPTKTRYGPSSWPFGQRFGASVIHLPSVVGTRSPTFATVRRYARAVTKVDSATGGQRVASRGMAADENPGRNRQGTCTVCDGRIYRYPLGDSMGSWVHLDKADWVDNPHDPVPA